MAKTHTTLTASQVWRPDRNVFNPADALTDALILQHSTVAGVINGDQPALRVAYVTDDAAQFTAEGAEIPEANPGLDQVLVHTAKITQLVRLSAEQWYQEGTAGELSQSVRRAITVKANSAFLTQPAPSSPAVTPPAGILNIAGTIAGDPVTGDLDTLVDLLAALGSNGGNPSGIILSPTAWASLRKLKTAVGSAVSILGAGTADATPMLLGVPVTVTNALTGDNGIVIDDSAIVSAVGPVEVAANEAIYFATDGVGLRATWRIGWNIVRPNRIGKFTVTATE